MQKEYIIKKLRLYKQKYQKEGLDIIGIFGSYARGEQDRFSDIDIVYHLDYDKFSKKYKDGFSKLLKINNIKEELEREFKKKG